MIEVQQPCVWQDGHVDGQVTDLRSPAPPDDLLPAATLTLGDPRSGPSLMLSIEGRRYPRRTPAHLHKSDTFRMALGAPIAVGPTTYAHGEFRLQQANTFYGPEHWTDEVGTNQLLVMADRRGGKPWLTSPELQLLADLGGTPEEDSARGYAPLPRDAEVDHVVVDNLGARTQAGSRSGGFSTADTWPSLPDGTTLGVVAIGDRRHGPLLLLWNRPPHAVNLPPARTPCDLVRLTVDGDHRLGGRVCGRLAFRVVEAGSQEPASAVGAEGCQELWFLADRTGVADWLRAWEGVGPVAADEVTGVLARALDPAIHAAPSPPTRAAQLARSATLGGRGDIELHHRRSDDEIDSHYLVAVDSASGQTVAFSEAVDDPRDLLPLVEALRGSGTSVRTLHDEAHGVWLFRIVDAEGGPLLRSLPCPDEETVRATVARLRDAAPSLEVVGDATSDA